MNKIVKKNVFMQLIKNEMIKFYSTRIVFIIVSLIIFGVLLLALSIDLQKETVTFSSEYILENEIQELSECVSGEYGISKGAEQYYKNMIKIKEYMLKNDIDVLKIHSIGNLILSLNQMFAIIVIIMILGAGKIWADEFSYGTLVSLVSKPVSRCKIFIAKLITLLSLCIFVELLLNIISIIIGGIFWGLDGLNASLVSYNNGIIEKTIIEQMFQYSFYNFFTLFACAIVTVILSLIIKNGIIATSISVMFYFVGSSFVLSLAEYQNLKYSLLANIQFQIYMDGNELFEGMTLGYSITNIIIHSVIILLIAFIIFYRRNADE